MTRDYPDPVVLAVGIVVSLAVMIAGYIGWWLGHEQGMCSVGCEDATAGAGEGIYRDGACRCFVNGREVRPL